MGMEARFKDLLNKLCLYASAGVRSSNIAGDKITSSKSGSVIMSMEIDPDPYKWIKRWNKCETDPQREDLCDKLETEVLRWSIGPSKKHVLHPQTLEWKAAIMRDLEEHNQRRVCRMWGISSKTLQKIKKDWND